MSRNPSKARCQIPGCRSWAMRGHIFCRSHRDAELGSCGGGAPAGNLNALKTGQHAHPFDPVSLHRLAQQLAADPQQLSAHLQRAIASILTRTGGDPVRTLIALQAALAQLQPLLAQELFLAGLQDLLRRLPPQRRSRVQAALCRHALPLSPQDRLRLLRVMAARFDDHLRADRPPLPAVDPQQGPHPFSSLLHPPAPHSSFHRQS